MVAVNGDRSKKDVMRRVMEKADFKSVRGNFKFGNNHVPIQNFYLQDVAKGKATNTCSKPWRLSSRTTRIASTIAAQ